MSSSSAPDLQSCQPDSAYPPGPYGSAVGSTLDNFTFRDGTGEVAMSRFYLPFSCQKRASLLVLRVQAAWCGPCQWHAAHTRELLDSTVPDVKGRLTVVDVLIRDRLNQPAGTRSLATFTPFYDRTPLVVADGNFSLRPFGMSQQDGDTVDKPLPLIVVVDVRLMRVEAVLSNPDPDTLQNELRKVLARLDGLPEPDLPAPARMDERFTRDRWQQIQQMAVATAPPLDPTNRYETNVDAIALGQLLFQDANLGPTPDAAACAGCHQPTNFRMDGRPTAVGYDTMGAPTRGDRNTLWLGGVAWSRFQFWDGRVDSLWAQALGPLESPKEYSSTRLRLVHTVLSRHHDAYVKVFGTPLDLSDTTRFPADGKPGLPAWDSMAEMDQRVVNQIFANLGKAIAAYERRIRPAAVALDRYAAGQSDALTPQEKDGLLRFFDLGCAHCHHGPMLSDGAFHNLRFGTGRQDGTADRGWRDGVSELLRSDFRGNGPYSDAPLAATWLDGLTPTADMLGQFKTPSLRGVADTAPYGHGGDLPTLDKVIELYADRGLADNDPRAIGLRDTTLVKFDKLSPQVGDLVRFLQTFTGGLIEE